MKGFVHKFSRPFQVRVESLVRNHVRFLENRLLFHRVKQRKLPEETFAWQQTELALRLLTVKVELWKSLIPKTMSCNETRR
jgi:hypothetical protein